MELFAVFKVAAYRHECGGIFSSLELAEQAATKLVAGERDDHHNYEIVPFTLDAITPQTERSRPWPSQSQPERFMAGGELHEADAVVIFNRRNGEVQARRQP